MSNEGPQQNIQALAWEPAPPLGQPDGASGPAHLLSQTLAAQLIHVHIKV